MRIAFVYDIPYPWHKGGIEHILNTEAEELAKKNRVDYLTMKWPGMGNEFRHRRVRYHAFGNLKEETAYRHGRRSIREAILFSLYLLNLFRYDFDMIITNAFPILHLPIVKAYCRIKKARLVVRVDEVWDRNYWVEYLGRVWGNLANAYANMQLRSNWVCYVANSDLTAEKLLAKGIRKERVTVFAPILDDALLSRAHRIRGAHHNVVFSGRFIKEKRIDKWLQVLRGIKDKKKDTRSLLIGEGIEAKRIRAIIRALRLRDNVTIKPFHKNKMALYRDLASSDVMLHMSEREGLSIITLESLALGTPVVLPEYSPIPREVREMCVVEKEDRLPDKVLEIIRSGNKRGYIKNPDKIRLFLSSNINEFYNRLFYKN